MQQDDRMTAQKVLVQRMTSIVTRLVPDGSGAHLRFINKSKAGLDNLTKDGIEENMDFKPAGGTMIGTNLKRKILEPFIYNVIEQGDVLLRPYLILIVTDGDPTNEDPSKLKNAIVECGRRLTDRGYPQEGMRADCPQPYLFDIMAGCLQALQSCHVPHQPGWPRGKRKAFPRRSRGRCRY